MAYLNKTNLGTVGDPIADSALLATLSRRNLIINGNFLINQRSWVLTSTAITAGTYTVDRWKGSTTAGNIVFTVTNNETVVTVPTGGFEQVIEGLNIQSGTYTVSFTATGDTVCTVDGVTKASGDTFTLTGGTNATVKFSSVLGTGTVKLIQVERGSVATPFEHRPYGQELALCQRYYYRETPGNALPFRGTGWTRLAANTSGITVLFPVSMRIAPTAIEQSGTATDYSVLHENTASVCNGVPAYSSASVDSGTFLAQSNGTTAGYGCGIRPAVASAYIGWSAEL